MMNADYDKLAAEMKDRLAAKDAEIERLKQENGRLGEHTYTQSQLDNVVKRTWAATIERCAQWLEDQYPCYKTVASEMRKSIDRIKG